MRHALLLTIALLLALGGMPVAWSAMSAGAGEACCGDACTCGDTCPCGIERNPAPDRPAAPAAIVSFGGERLATPPDRSAPDLAAPTGPPIRLRSSTCESESTSGRQRLLLKSVWQT